MILLLILIAVLIMAALTGHIADTRDPEYQLWVVPKGNRQS